MALDAPHELSEPFAWPAEGVSRVPFRLFSDPEIYALEQEKIFRGPVWNFLCMEFDVKAPGDFKTSFVGETPVVVTRDRNGEVHALVNRCAHKGALVCLKERGNAKSLTCVYHSWNYALDGRLIGLAFKNGIGGKGVIGFGLDFAVVKNAEAFGGGNNGEYYWGGMANTVFWIDPVDEVVAIFMANVLPYGAIDPRTPMRKFVNEAVMD